MPTLHWIGKEKVINHHQEVPFRVLEHKYGFRAEDEGNKTENKSGNKIIHGDNLEALKALLPEYEGRIKCIYIDPPYNTGNEKWVYNDNVNDPKIKKWLGEVVGKQGEDLSRHDKWLCMMYPRLKLLYHLLANTGAIFISIDDNEIANLKLMCDEIFGANCFITDAIWRSSDNSNNNSLKFSADYNHTLIYSKQVDWKPNFINDLNKRKHFRNPDNDLRGPWFDGNPVNNPAWRPNLQFDITTPSGKLIKHPANGWRWSLETIKEKLQTGELRFSDDETRLIRRTYLNELGGLTPSNLWIDLEVTGHTRGAKYDLKKIFSETKPTDLFETPKSFKLIEYILQLSTNNDSIVLDSFAGSGTTAHAVLNLNKKDDGNRKFILIEMEDYAETITAERVRRVEQGYADVAGTGGEFDYYELGMPIFKEDKNLNEEVCEDKIREYIYYTETKQHLERERSEDNRYLLDNYNDTGYYFYYEKEQMTTFCLDTLNIITERAEQYVVYADKCLIDENDLAAKNIVFKKIPRDIKRF